MKKTAQDMKVKMKSIKETQTKVNWKRNVGTQIRTSEASLINKI